MQDTEEADFRTQASRIAGHFEKSFRTGVEQEIVNELLVLQQRSHLTRQCEDHVQLARGEQFSLTRGDPAIPSRGLTLRAVPVSTANGENPHYVH